MKSKSKSINEHDGSKVPPITQEEWVETVKSIRSKIVHLYFFRSTRHKSLSRNPRCIEYQPVCKDGAHLTEYEESIISLFLNDTLNKCLAHPQFGKNERETLAQINTQCQTVLLGEPVFHVENYKGNSV